MAEEENKAGQQPEQQSEQPKSLEQEQREEIEQLFEDVSLGLMVAEAQIDGGFDSYEQFDEFMVTQVGPKHKRLQQIVPQYGMTSKGSDQWKNYLKQLKDLTQQNDALIASARGKLPKVNGLTATQTPVASQPESQNAAQVQTSLETPESKAQSAYEKRIADFKNLIQELRQELDAGKISPDQPWKGHNSVLQFFRENISRFENLVLTPLETSSSLDLRELAFDVKNGIYADAQRLYKDVQAQYEQAMRTAPGEWKDYPRYELEFSEITDLRDILSTNDLTTMSDEAKIDLIQQTTDLTESLITKLNASTLPQAEKDLIVQVYIKDVFDFTTGPLNTILDKVTQIQTGKLPNTTVDDIDKLKNNYNLYFQLISSRRFSNAFQTYFGKEMQQLISLANSVGQFEQMEDFFKEEQLNTMGYEQLARLIVKVNIDPFEYHEARKGGQDAYKALVVSKVKERLFGPNPEDPPWKDHERQRWFVWMSLKFLDDKHQYENQSATGSRKDLESHLALHLLTREKLARVTYADPEYGVYFEKLVKALRVQAALKPPPENMDLTKLPTVEAAKKALSGMSKEELRVRNPMMTKEGQVAIYDGEFYVFSDGVKYGTLASESIGRNVMDAYFSRVERPSSLSDDQVNMAKDLASRIYTSFTILDESFYELQAATETRGHNTKEDDFGAVHKQTAAAVHRAMRYAKERVDAIAMWSPFNLKQVPDYYFLNNRARNEFLHFLHMHQKHQGSFYPTELVFGQVEFPEFMQEIFPNNSALFTLQPGERLWVADPSFKGQDSINESDLTHILIDNNRTPLLRRNKKGEVYSVDGKTKYGRIIISSDQSTATNTSKSNDDALLSGTFEFPNGDVKRMPSVKLNIGGREMNITENIIDTRHYYVAFEGMKEVNELVFSKIPGNLTSDQILNKSSTGNGMIDTLMSSIGKLKMFPSFAIDNLIYPYMMQYILQIIQAYQSPRPEERLPLIAEIVRQITRTSQYGGLGRANIKPQVTKVVDNLITTKQAQAIQDNVWPSFTVDMWSDSTSDRQKLKVFARPATLPYYRWRNKELVDYLKELWEEEFTGLEVPPLGNSIRAEAERKIWLQKKKWNNQEITPRMWHIIKASTYEDKIPTFLNKKAKFEVSDEEAKKGH